MLGNRQQAIRKAALGYGQRTAFAEPEALVPSRVTAPSWQGRASWKPRHPRTGSRFHRRDRPRREGLC